MADLTNAKIPRPDPVRLRLTLLAKAYRQTFRPRATSLGSEGGFYNISNGKRFPSCERPDYRTVFWSLSCPLGFLANLVYYQSWRDGSNNMATASQDSARALASFSRKTIAAFDFGAPHL